MYMKCPKEFRAYQMTFKVREPQLRI